GPALQLYCWGEADVASFPWFEAPRGLSVERAESLLRRLGALHHKKPTELGRRMVRLPVHPRIARLLIEGQRLGIAERASLAAAMLSERDPFRRDIRFQLPAMLRSRHRSESDVLDRLEILEEFERSSRADPQVLNVGAARFVIQARDQ